MGVIGVGQLVSAIYQTAVQSKKGVSNLFFIFFIYTNIRRRRRTMKKLN